MARDKGNAGDWTTADMLANQAQMNAASNPSRAVQEEREEAFVSWAGSADEGWQYIKDNKLNKIAARNGATVGVRKVKRGVYEVYTSKPKKK